MTSLIYSTGAVSVSNGSAVVIGSLTGWVVALVKGGVFSCAGLAIPIASVEDDTHLTLAYPWPGLDAGAVAYAISRDSSEAVQAAWTNDRLATIIQRLSLVGVHPDGSGTIAERDALSPTPDNGFLWLYAEAGHELEFYRKVASGWEGPFPVTGDTGEPGPIGAGLHPAGAWAIGDTYNKGDYVSFGERTFASLADGNVGNEPPSADSDDAYWMWTPAAVGPQGIQGIQGIKGDTGDDATITVGTVTGVNYGQPAAVTNVGTPGSAVFDFEIPKGQDGSGTGDVVGPAVAAANRVALFNGTTGKTIKDSGSQIQSTLSDTTANSLMKVGAFGLGGAIYLASPNLNDNLATGFYSVDTPTNGPGGNGWFTVKNLPGFPDYADQEFTRDATGGRYVRSKIGGVWQSWRSADSFGNALFYARDEKPQGTAGGASVAAANNRDINTIKINEIGATLAANVITFLEGTYTVQALAPSYASDAAKLALVNASTSALLLEGSNDLSYSVAGANIARNEVFGRLMVPAGGVSFVLRQYLATAKSINGLGSPVNRPGFVEVYSEIRAWRTK